MISFWWIIWATGAVFWVYVIYAMALIMGRPIVFAHRMGWKNARRFRLSSWLGWTMNPPDKVGDWYWPSKSGREMRMADEAEWRRWDAALQEPKPGHPSI